MKILGFAIGFLTTLSITVSATVLYVDVNSTNAAPPYTNWATAAVVIQHAIDAADPGDQILVTNGVYRTGGRAVHGTLTNRVVVNKAVTVQSVNGPEVTFIEGRSLIGSNAVRCVYLTNNAALNGFTLTKGSSLKTGNTNYDRSGGGLWCESTDVVVSNCLMIANSAYWFGAGAYSGTLRNCTINNNTNFSGTVGGGGAVGFSVLFNCTISSNYNALAGGQLSGGLSGAVGCTLSNCVVTANSSVGAKDCTLYDCLVTGSSLGMSGGTAYNCVISNNTSGGDGGGAYQATLNNCILCANQAMNGGGASDCTLNFCTVSNNVATHFGGGVYRGVFAAPGLVAGVSNTIVGNTAGLFGGGYHSYLNKSLTNWIFINNSTPGDGGGVYLVGGNLVLNNCTFTSNSAAGNGGGIFRVVSSSSTVTCSNCSFNGNTAGLNGGGTHSVSLNGCLLTGNSAQNGGGAFYGSLINCNFTGNVAVANGGGWYGSVDSPGFININCIFSGNSAGNGGGIHGTGMLIASNFTFVGNTALTNGAGIFCGGSGAVLRNCSFTENLAMNSGGGAYYTSQGTIITNSLLANNSAGLNGGGVCGPSPGSAPRTGILNCTLTNNSSENGGGAYNASLTGCLLSGNWATTNGGAACNATLSSCSVTNNWAHNGGGAYGSSLTQCILSGNWAANGGGVYSSTIIECLLRGNSANSGGGGYAPTMNNSTVVGNWATNAGGGAFFPSAPSLTMRSSIVYYNSAPSGPEYSGNAGFLSCCTAPAPQNGLNISNSPAFVDWAGGNLRLQSNSPCINIGIFVLGTPNVDLDGRPRERGRIDLGAYEYQGPGMGEFTACLQQNGLPSNGSVDFKDTDADGLNNWQEWIAGTIPSDASSVLKMSSPSNNTSGLDVSWQSVTNRTYYLQRATDPAAQPAFSDLQSNIVGQAGATTYADTTATNGGPYFYRAGVQ